MDDLDSNAVASGDYILRLVCLVADHVLADRQPAVHPAGQSETADREQTTQCDRAAAHVFMHVQHRIVRLQIGSTGVETNAFAHQGQQFAAGLFRAILEMHDAGVAAGIGLSNGQERTGAFFFEFFLPKQLVAPTLALCQHLDQPAVIG